MIIMTTVITSPTKLISEISPRLRYYESETIFVMRRVNETLLTSVTSRRCGDLRFAVLS